MAAPRFPAREKLKPRQSFPFSNLGLEPVTRRKSRDETRARRQVTRRDTRRSRSTRLETKSDETRRDSRPVHKYLSQNSKTSFFAFLRELFWTEKKKFFRDRLARQTHETRRDRDGLVSSRLDFFRDETVSLPALESPSRRSS